jgi:sec-independent protein translocase protein TatC
MKRLPPTMSARTRRRARRGHDVRMPLREHLAELRNRILLVLAGLVVGAIGGWFLFDPAFTALQQPLIDIAEQDNALVTVNFAGVASALDMRFKVSLFLGLLISAPWWLYQIWAFIAPGLTGKERRYTVGFLASSIPLFLLGVGAAWLLFPQAVTILTDFRPDDTTQLLDAQLYLTFAMRLLVAFGLAFVFPVVMVALTWLGIVPSRVWLKGWRWAVLLIFIFTAIMTPTPDGIMMTIMAIPIIALYFGGIGIGALGVRRRAKERA